MAPPHPLQNLSTREIDEAREILLSQHNDQVISFREIFLDEPAKIELVAFLELEHSGHLTPSSPRPSRRAKCQYDVIDGDKVPEYHESIIDITNRCRAQHEVIGKEHHASLTM
jgi:primary-amine oxidase